jgi:hypothetical protein
MQCLLQESKIPHPKCISFVILQVDYSEKSQVSVDTGKTLESCPFVQRKLPLSTLRKQTEGTTPLPRNSGLFIRGRD